MEKNDSLSKYKEYFGDDLTELEKEIAKTDSLFEAVQKNIDKIQSSENRLSYHYLIENFKNIISIQTQKQSFLKDKVNLKKIIMDYELKDSANTSEQSTLNEKLMELISITKSQAAKALDENENSNDTNLDFLIEESLKEDMEEAN